MEKQSVSGQGQVIRPEYVSVQDAARYLARSQNAVWHLRKKGKLRAYKPDKRVMFKLADLDRFMRGE